MDEEDCPRLQRRRDFGSVRGSGSVKWAEDIVLGWFPGAWPLLIGRRGRSGWALLVGIAAVCAKLAAGLCWPSFARKQKRAYSRCRQSRGPVSNEVAPLPTIANGFAHKPPVYRIESEITQSHYANENLPDNGQAARKEFVTGRKSARMPSPLVMMTRRSVAPIGFASIGFGRGVTAVRARLSEQPSERVGMHAQEFGGATFVTARDLQRLTQGGVSELAEIQRRQ